MARQRSGWTVGKRIGVGFGLVLVVLAAMAGWSIMGFSGVVGKLGRAVECNVLQSEIAQREIDHLNWAGKVNALLTDENVTTLEVQTDPHKCGFGTWYYGEGRRKAEELIPEAKQALAAVEEPHRCLHESAIEIGQVFRQADAELPAFLAEKEGDHLRWVNACLTLFAENGAALQVQTDCRKCGLGEFLYGQAGQRVAGSDPEMARAIEALKVPHEKLHQSAIAIQETWRQQHEGLVNTLRARLDDHRRWAAAVAGALLAQQPLDVQTDPSQCAFGKWLNGEECQRLRAEWPEFGAAMKKVVKHHDELHASAINITGAADAEAKGRIYETATAPALQAVAACFGDVIELEEGIVAAGRQAKHIFATETLPILAETQTALHALRDQAVASLAGMNQANAVFAQQSKPALARVQALLTEVGKAAHEAAEAQNHGIVSAAQSTRFAVGVVSALAVLVGVILAFFIARSIIKVLARIVAALNEGADQVNDAAGQVSSASQQLAGGRVSRLPRSRRPPAHWRKWPR